MNRAKSIAVVGGTLLFVGCGAIPDVTFVDDVVDGSVPTDASTRTDASAGDARATDARATDASFPDGSTQGCPGTVPSYADKCCGSVPCSGAECANCDTCTRKGCDGDEACCTQGNTIICRKRENFSCR